MLTTIVSISLYVLFPVCTIILGAVIATFRSPSAKVGSAIQHFAAGTVFAAVAVELL
jgi:ZIP family zinc transporter